jgi:transcription initiation protein SPT3
VPNEQVLFHGLTFSYLDAKATSDIIDVLGFLAYELVSKLTEHGLMIKKEWDERQRLNGKQEEHEEENENALFVKSTMSQTPLEPKHIREAFRRMQKQSFALSHFAGGRYKNSSLALV